jgi:competence protein ComEC
MAVPLSGCILFAEIALLLLSGWEQIAIPLGYLIGTAIQTMNRITEQIAKLPGAITEHIYLSTPLLLLLLACIGSCTIWLLQKKSVYRFLSLVTLSGILIIQCLERNETQRQFQLIICNLPKTGVAMLTEGRHYAVIGDSSLWKSPQLYQQYIKPIRTYLRVKPGIIENVRWEHNLLSTNTRSVLFLNQFNPGSPPATPKKLDVLIITGNPRVYIQDLLRYLQPKTIVFDASNPQWKINYWKKDCDQLHLRHHSVPEKGAFVMDL